MNSRDLSIIVLASIWLFFCLLFLVLTLRFARKHKMFKKVRQKQEHDFENCKSSFTLQTEKIVYELPEGERCYFSGPTALFRDKKQSNQKKTRFNKKLQAKGVVIEEDEDEIFADLGAISFHKAFSLEKQQFRLQQKQFRLSQYQGALYITNHRALIVGEEHSFQVALNDIKEVLLAVIQVKGIYTSAIRLILKTHDNDLFFSTDDIKMYFTFITLIKNLENQD